MKMEIPVLKKIRAETHSTEAAALEKAILQRMPERSILAVNTDIVLFTTFFPVFIDVIRFIVILNRNQMNSISCQNRRKPSD